MMIRIVAGLLVGAAAGFVYSLALEKIGGG